MYGSIYGRATGGYGAPSRNPMFGANPRGFGAPRAPQLPPSAAKRDPTHLTSCEAPRDEEAQLVFPAPLTQIRAAGQATRSGGPAAPNNHYQGVAAPTRPLPPAHNTPAAAKFGYVTAIFNSPTWSIPNLIPGVIPLNLVTDSSCPEAFDVMYSTFKAPCKGLYHFDFVAEVMATTTGSPTVTVAIFINNLSRVPVTYTAPVAGAISSMSGFWQGVLEAGDVVNLRAVTLTATGTLHGNTYANVLPYPTSMSAWWVPQGA